MDRRKWMLFFGAAVVATIFVLLINFLLTLPAEKNDKIENRRIKADKNMETNATISSVPNGDPKNSNDGLIKVTNKVKLLEYFKNITCSKTITGVYFDLSDAKPNPEAIQTLIGELPGILTTKIPKYTSTETKWDSFVNETILNWNNGYLVHILWCYDGNPLTNMIELKTRNDNRWNDLITEDGDLHNLWSAQLDNLAPYLQKLQTAGVVPICDLLPFINEKYGLWNGRPGLNGSLKLYQMTRDYLTNQHGLTSLIWVWSIHATGDMVQLEDYWPGNNYVDVASVYMGWTRDLTTTTYQKLKSVVDDKPMSMEWMVYVPKPTLLAVQSRWTWFTATYSTLQFTTYNNRNDVNATFHIPSVINKGDPDFFKTIKN